MYGFDIVCFFCFFFFSSRRRHTRLQGDWSSDVCSSDLDALFVSPSKGLVLFSVIEGKTLPEYAEIQDEGFNKMQAKLLQHQNLIHKRKLLVDIHTLTFAPALNQDRKSVV